jgi:hypothetical protein
MVPYTMKLKPVFLIHLFLFLALFIMLPLGSVFAQPCPAGCTGPNCEFCTDPSTIPLDGGLLVMLASGIMLGVRKIYKQSQ